MSHQRRNTGLLLALAVLAFVCAKFALAKNADDHDHAQMQMQMNAQRRAEHVLNRLAFGPRPGDVAQVTAIGVDKWIDLQLHPEKINDDALESRLAPLRTLRMDTKEMSKEFPSQQVIKQVADGKLAMPSGGARHAVYMAQMERYEEKISRKQEAGNATPQAASTDVAQNEQQQNVPQQNAMSDQDRMKQDRIKEDQRQTAESDLPQLLNEPADQRFQAILKLSTEEQIALASLNEREREPLLDGMTPDQREIMGALRSPQQVVTDELMQGKLMRAIYSQRQLQEVMTDFWFNHFNVFIGKGPDRYMLTSYERDVIRPHALGKFEDLLVATARSPAMLFYLDNWQSVGPDSDFSRGIPKYADRPWMGRRRFPPPPRPQRQPKAKRPSGLNENYGRELMELHTLGVNGGYTQKDVTEVARVFTGWTLKEPRDGGGFFFDERKHEPGDKMVLGHRIKPHGEQEGLEVLRMLAHSPATAHFICTKLAVRFVSDNPSDALVNAMAKTFLKKDGDIREVMKMMLSSPEFWGRRRLPREGENSAGICCLSSASHRRGDHECRATRAPAAKHGNASLWRTATHRILHESCNLGNSSALLARMNFALALTTNRLHGTQVDVQHLSGESNPADVEQTLAILENNLLEGNVSRQTHGTIAARLQDPAISRRKLDDPARPPDVAMIEGLLLGSPEFQKR